MTTTHVDTRPVLDTDQVYRLAGGVHVRPRPGGDIQIGTGPGRCLLLRDAPISAAALLSGSTDGLSLGAWWRRHALDPLVWRPVFAQLLSSRLLVPVIRGDPSGPPPDAGLRGELDFLTHRHGPRAAARALRARADALVVVRGSGRAAVAVAAQLAAAGVGHVHPRPDGPVLSERPDEAGSTTADEGRRLAALVREASPTVRAHAPAAHVPPVLTVLAADAPTDPGRAAELTHAGLAHLVLRVEATRAVVGPLVLPGRSSCLLCAARHLSDADPHWPSDLRVPRALPGPGVLVHAAAARATHEALEYVDGLAAPVTIDGTLEWTSGGAGPRRRSWRRHPDCGCGRTAAPP